MTGRSFLAAFLSGAVVTVLALGFGYYLAPDSTVENLAATTANRGGPGAPEAPASVVRPIDEVVEGERPRIVDITHENAVLVFRSLIPLACSVVYGPSPAFGRIATVQDMGGGAIIEHDPLLAGLEPDTEYFYRVQGTAADGVIYVGEMQSFRTAPAPPPPQVEEAAEGRPDASRLMTPVMLGDANNVVEVSSNYGGAANDQPWGVNQAFDGNARTAWSSNGDGDNAYLQLDFGGVVKISAVEVWTRTMSDGTAQISSFTLTGDDATVYGPFELPDASRLYRFDIDIDTTTLRFDVETSSGGNTGLVEFNILGEAAP